MLNKLKKDLAANQSKEELYQKIMELGKTLPPYLEEWKTEDHLVTGCQSIMYLHAELKNGNVYFFAHSDALISAGLAAILIEAYSGTAPETIFKEPPTFLDELGIVESLTPGRANGLSSLYLKMKQEAVKLIHNS